MSEDTIEPFGFPAIARKKLTAAFDGGRLTSDGGVMLLAAAERRMGIADRLATLIFDQRNPLLVTHVALPQGKCYRAQLIASAKMLPTAGMLFPILQPALERNGHLKLETEIRCKILSMSAATIDRLLRIPRRTTLTRRLPYGVSDPSRLAAGNIVGEAAGNRIT
jgi:hypothetical protein